MGARWRRRFPKASKDEIREFLRLVTEIFAFPPKHLLCFEPDDKVMELYEAIYPPGWALAEAFELEDLASDIERKYGVDVVHHWSDEITLGNLFKLSKTNTEPAA